MSFLAKGGIYSSISYCFFVFNFNDLCIKKNRILSTDFCYALLLQGVDLDHISTEAEKMFETM